MVSTPLRAASYSGDLEYSSLFLVDLIDHITGIRNRVPVDTTALVGRREVTGAATMFIQ